MTERNTVEREALNVLLGSVVHDLRNPLAALVANLAFARRVSKSEANSPDLAEALEESAVACESLRHIVSNLELLVQSASERSSKLEEAMLDVVQEVVARCRSRAQLAGVDLRFEGPTSGVSPAVDKATFGSALENHLMDGIRHAGRGAAVVVSWIDSKQEASVRISVSKSTAQDLRPPSTRDARVGPSSRVSDPPRAKSSSAEQFAHIAASLGGFDIEIDDAGGRRSVSLTIRQ